MRTALAQHVAMRILALAVALSLGGLALTGCDVEDPDAAESDLTQSLTLRFESAGGALSLKSSGKKLVCADRFEGLAGERVTCTRSGETLQVIVKSDGVAEDQASVIAVRDLGGKRGYYACTPSGDVEGLPSQMKCKATTIRPRGSGGLSSPFDSSVEGVGTPNTHWVDDAKSVLRGMEPRTPEEFTALKGVGVSRVLIFKNTTGKDDVTKEIAGWQLPAKDVLHVPFQWKDLPGFKAPCEQTVQALKFIQASEKAKQKVFFHCTVGEDRTGYLAALYDVLFHGTDAREAFDQDMCERGYGKGNPQKPGFVVGQLEDSLAPLYRSMAHLIAEKKLTKTLDPAVCAVEPTVPEDFLADAACGVSTTLVP